MSMKDRISTIEDRLDSFKDEIWNIKMGVDNLVRRMEQAEMASDLLDKKIDDVLDKFERAMSGVENNHSNIMALREAQEDHNERIKTLEATAHGHQMKFVGKIDNLEMMFANLNRLRIEQDEDLIELKSKLKFLETKLGYTDGCVSRNNDAIGEVVESVKDIKRITNEIQKNKRDTDVIQEDEKGNSEKEKTFADYMEEWGFEQGAPKPFEAGDIAKPGTFEWAIIQAKQGKKIRRAGWFSMFFFSEGYGIRRTDKDTLLKCFGEDILATDWEVVS